MRSFRRSSTALAVTIFMTGHALAQTAEPTHDVNALAKQTQNPVSNLTSVPFQFNFNAGGDLEERTFFNLNIQPVIPFKAASNRIR